MSPVLRQLHNSMACVCVDVEFEGGQVINRRDDGPEGNVEPCLD